RQFHDTVTRIFGHSPSVVRERARQGGAEDRSRAEGTSRARGIEAGSSQSAALTAQLAVRRPFDGPGLATWFAARAIPGVEHVEDLVWSRAVQLPHGPGVLQVDLGARSGPLPLTLRLADLRDYAGAVALTRRLLDLDADPLGIAAGLT